MRRGMLLLVVAVLPALAGCVIAHGGTKVVVDDAARIPVGFESAQAADDFYKGLAMADQSRFSDAGGYFVFGIAAGGGITFHETAHYNDQVRRADIDTNGVITEDEAKGYLKRLPRAEDH